VGRGGDFRAQVGFSRGYYTANLVENVGVATGVCVMVLNVQPRCVSSLIFTLPRLDTKKRIRQRNLDRDQTLHATTPALMRLPATGRLSAITIHHFVTHVATFVHDMQTDLRIAGTSDI
jgi:hypothetical protein